MARGVIYRNQLSMTQRALPLLATVIASADDFTVANDDGSHRHFSSPRGLSRCGQRRLHELKIVEFHFCSTVSEDDTSACDGIKLSSIGMRTRAKWRQHRSRRRNRID
jgi:hypothetical protein